MKTVLVTGSRGFIGKNLCAQLQLDKDLEVLEYTRENSSEDLTKFVDKADFIFHIAGINRPEDPKEFDNGNRRLTEDIISRLNRTGNKAPLLITSSTQASLDNLYGESKKAAEEAAIKWASAGDAQLYLYRLPNVFGKWSKPNYNSVVATFCHNVSRGLDITVNDASVVLQLAYIDDVVKEFVRVLGGVIDKSADYFYEIPRVFNVPLGEIVTKLENFQAIRNTAIIPNLEDAFDRFLYATYTSYFDIENFSYELDKKSDDRGWLAEFVKSNQSGQIFVSKTKPGVARGNHWHHTKIEKFLVISGKADITFRKVNSEEVITYSVTGEDCKVIDIPAGYIHAITNTGEEDLTTIFWADELLDKDNPDTYYSEV